jgi:hypothetical protein
MSSSYSLRIIPFDMTCHFAAHCDGLVTLNLFKLHVV